jgi:hypothetical protein
MIGFALIPGTAVEPAVLYSFRQAAERLNNASALTGKFMGQSGS